MNIKLDTVLRVMRAQCKHRWLHEIGFASVFRWESVNMLLVVTKVPILLREYMLQRERVYRAVA
jgi:hypothetical protein